MRRTLAYLMSLVVLGAAAWMPYTAYAQVLPGSPFGGSGGGGGVSLSGTNTWTATNTFNAGAGNASLIITLDSLLAFAGSTANAIGGSSENTPDTTLLLTGSASNLWVVAERADQDFDFAHPLQTNPTLFVENAAQDTTQHNGMAYYGNQGRALTTLTESTNTSVVRIPLGQPAGAGGTVTFTAVAADATDIQTLTGVLQYAAVNKAGTETCSVPTLAGTALNSVSVGTLTCTYACDTTPANAVDIQFNCVSSLTQTSLALYWRLNNLGVTEPLPQ